MIRWQQTGENGKKPARRCRVIAAKSSEVIYLNIDDFINVFQENQIQDLQDKCFNYREEEVRKLISLTLGQHKNIKTTIKDAAMTNLPTQIAHEAIGNYEISKEQKRRKITPWVHHGNNIPGSP